MWGPRPISYRRFRALVRGLPFHESALGRALGMRQAGEWGNVEELLKVIAEQVDAGNRLFVMANSKKGAAKPKPLTIERPEPRRPKHAPPPPSTKKRPATSEELVAFFGGAARYTPSSDGNPVTSPGGRPRCPRGHFTSPPAPCSRCGSPTLGG